MRIEKERLDYLDIAKAITIFLVLMGHTGASTSTFLYRRIIYTFHMPLFLLISGIVSGARLPPRRLRGPGLPQPSGEEGLRGAAALFPDLRGALRRRDPLSGRRAGAVAHP